MSRKKEKPITCKESTATQGCWAVQPMKPKKDGTIECWAVYFYCTMLRDADVTWDLDEKDLHNLMEADNEGNGILQKNLFAWSTAAELVQLRATHSDARWADLWSLDYEEIFTGSIRPQNSQEAAAHKAAFIAKRRDFLRQHVAAIFPRKVDGGGGAGTWVLHLRSQFGDDQLDEPAEFSRLSNGFIIMPTAFEPEFLTTERANELLAAGGSYRYPWPRNDGDEAWRLITKYGAQNRKMTVHDLATRLQERRVRTQLLEAERGVSLQED